jgi:hypothetical protein
MDKEFETWWQSVQETIGDDLEATEVYYSDLKRVAYKAWKAGGTSYMRTTLHMVIDTVEECRKAKR